MSTKEKLLKALADVPEQDFENLLRIIEAWKRSKKTATSFMDQLLNVKFIGFDPEKNVYKHKILITEELKNRIQTLHGGVTATFVDIAMGLSLLRDMGPNIKIVTLDLSVRYLAPGLKGWIIAEIEIVKKGRSIIVLEAKLRDEQEKIIAIASGTFFRIE